LRKIATFLFGAIIQKRFSIWSVFMPQNHFADAVQIGTDEFWERMRLAINVPCLISGVFCAERRILQDATVSAHSDSDPEVAKEIIRQTVLRLSASTVDRSVFLPKKGQNRGDLPPVGFPVWLRMNNVTIGIGRPLASLYPVVAYEEMDQGTNPTLQNLLGIGLVHTAHALTRQAYTRPTWPEGLAESTLRLLGIGLFVVDARGTIIYEQSAEDRTKNAVWQTSRARLSVRSETEQVALRAAIADATSDKQLGSIISVTSEEKGMQMVAVAPLKQGDSALAIVLFELRQTNHRAMREHFFKVHGLTRSEGLVAREVLDGRAPTEIAELTGMSVGTVRGYLKQVFSKTGTHRQSELVSHYFASILPIGATIARADVRVGPGGPKPGKLTLVHNSPAN
jgi:DNA-binding CsgD family transcriptional regulator